MWIKRSDLPTSNEINLACAYLSAETARLWEKLEAAVGREAIAIKDEIDQHLAAFRGIEKLSRKVR